MGFMDKIFGRRSESGSSHDEPTEEFTPEQLAALKSNREPEEMKAPEYRNPFEPAPGEPRFPPKDMTGIDFRTPASKKNEKIIADMKVHMKRAADRGDFETARAKAKAIAELERNQGK